MSHSPMLVEAATNMLGTCQKLVGGGGGGGGNLKFGFGSEANHPCNGSEIC